MPNIDMPYFVDEDGNQGYFKDVTARSQIANMDSDLTEAIKHTLKYTDPSLIDATVLARGGMVSYTTSYFSINKGRIGLGVCMDTGDANKYLIALLYRTDNSSQVKYVELAKNGLYISGTNVQGTAAISGNTGTRQAYTIVFY